MRGIVFVLLLAVSGKGEWIKLATPNFELYTQEGERDGKSAIIFYEQIRDFFLNSSGMRVQSKTPARIIAFRNEKEYIPYRVFQHAAAFYLGAHDRDYIVMRDLDTQIRPTALHEYTHLLIKHSGATIPGWINEGLAEVYSTTRELGGKVMVGEPLQGRLLDLRTNTRWINLPSLTAVDHVSSHYSDARRVGLFYSQSWALTHMLFLANDYRAKFGEFLNRIAAGGSTEESLRLVYGKTFTQIQRELGSYVRSDTFLAGLFNTKFKKITEVSIVTKPSDLEIGLVLANLLAVTRKGEEARKRYQELSAAHAGNAGIAEAMAYLEWSLQGSEKALPHFAKAASLGSQNPKLYFDYAMLLRMAQGKEMDYETLLKTALKLDPEYKQALMALAFHSYSHRRFGDAWGWFVKLKALKTDEAFSVLIAMAHCLHTLKDQEQALKMIERARPYAKTETQSVRLESMLRFLQYKPEEVAQRKIPDPTEGPISNFAAPGTFDPPQRPGFGLWGEVELEKTVGNFEHVECIGEKARVRIRSVSRVLELAILDPGLVFLKGTPGETIELNCGEQKPKEVLVIWEAKEQPELKANGILRILDFTVGKGDSPPAP